MVSLVALSGCRNRNAPPTTNPPDPESPAAEDPPPLPLGAPEADGDIASEPPLVIDFVNAGQGDCIHIACPSGNSILVDCGSTGKADPDLEDIVSALVEPAPEVRVVLTHQDLDHYSKLADVLEDASVGGKVKAVYVGGPRSWLPSNPSPSSTKKSERLAGWLDSHGATYPSPTFDGTELACGDDVTVDVLLAGFDTKNGSPSKPDGPRKNNASIVLRVERDGFAVVLAGDAYEAAEREIVNSGANVRADVLKLGHHGAEKSTGRLWLNAVRPEHIITTAGHHGTFKHPRCEVLDRVKPDSLARAPVHPVECYSSAAKEWEHRDPSTSIWNSCEAGHLRLVIKDGGKADLHPHIFAQDQDGDGGGEACPIRFSIRSVARQ